MTSNSAPTGVPDHVRDAVRAAGWNGVVLPRTKVSDYTVHPMVTIDAHIWADRVTAGQRPELDRSTLALWEAWTADLGAPPPRPAVSIVGFVSTATRAATALETLDALAGYGAGLWIATGPRRPRTLTLAEFNLAGIWVIHAHLHQAGVLVHGRRGPVHTAQRGVALRHKEELLFARALDSVHAQNGQVVA
ncbi:hypothetical protein [Nocardia fusca]|uniref:hypothetical protein n=1 Tax=Nocardia fusca TaxID=941183 RepID=UPI0007A7577D|nr:hypothetical protein [Nocardia fusca]